MKDFIQVILLLTQVSVIVTTLQVYLRINKIWKRKHEQDVAESQSIAGILLLIGNCILWIMYYIWVESDMLSIIDTSLYLLESAVFLVISTGLWVKGKQSRNLWQLAKSALRLEKKESTYLLKKIFKPKNADIIISILHQIAMIDDELDPKEYKIIQEFANHWGIGYSVDEMNEGREEESEYNFIRLRNSMMQYLRTDPPKDQVTQLKSMIQTLMYVDEKITKEERLIELELFGLIDNYCNNNTLNEDKYDVLIVPQDKEHHEVVETVIPNSRRVETAGGVAYSIGTYYSREYAEMTCTQFREINLFTIVYQLEEQS